MWLTDLLPDTNKACPTCPTCKNKVGQRERLAPVSLSDLSDLSDHKTDKETLSGDFLHKEKEFTQNSSKTPESVRLDSKALRENGNEENPVGRAYGENTFPTDQPTPEQIAHARRMLVDCPATGGKRHCWHCPRCDDARTCSAWRIRRHDVAFFRQSEKPYSLLLAECEAVEVPQ